MLEKVAVVCSVEWLVWLNPIHKLDLQRKKYQVKIVFKNSYTFLNTMILTYDCAQRKGDRHLEDISVMEKLII